MEVPEIAKKAVEIVSFTETLGLTAVEASTVLQAAKSIYDAKFLMQSMSIALTKSLR